MINALHQKLRRFLKRTDGSITLEAILYMPPILTLFLISLVLFDGFRTNNLSQKASYAIADAISRETVPMDDDFLNGMEQVYTEIVGRRAGYGLRFTVLRWSDTSDAYLVDWSRVRGDLITNTLNDADLTGMEDSLPILQNGERIIMVESRTDVNVPDGLRREDGTWAPPLAMRLDMDKFEMAANVITRPRFTPQVCWEAC
ncbi:TadE/TadG family type IV pilus assembly protein [Donghicola sp. XS_ASV15]|uniref:TadE/TadG family type IV pilus assembly protein n=1 Tax=Donghicola sp. XS_ASV15 TaxID=3241295 RepID=UPI003517CF20